MTGTATTTIDCQGVAVDVVTVQAVGESNEDFADRHAQDVADAIADCDNPEHQPQASQAAGVLTDDAGRGVFLSFTESMDPPKFGTVATLFGKPVE